MNEHSQVFERISAESASSRVCDLTCCVKHIVCDPNVTPHTLKFSLTTSGRVRDASRLLRLAALYAAMQPRTFHDLY
jgi:hypothetical protein